MQTFIKKKRINSKAKGNRAELELAKIMSERFGLDFARVGCSSGARTKNTKLPSGAIEVLTSDIIVPLGFRFVIESKSQNVEVDLLNQSALFDKFLEQVENDAASINKVPMLAWKRHRRGWITAIPFQAFEGLDAMPSYYAIYRVWVIARLDALLEIADQRFWFSNTEEKI
jgi:hypothetical protein